MPHTLSPVGLLPRYPCWSLVCLGPSSLYSHNVGLQEQWHEGFLPGCSHLLPWDLTVRLKGRPGWIRHNPRKNQQNSNQPTTTTTDRTKGCPFFFFFYYFILITLHFSFFFRIKWVCCKDIYWSGIWMSTWASIYVRESWSSAEDQWTGHRKRQWKSSNLFRYAFIFFMSLQVIFEYQTFSI